MVLVVLLCLFRRWLCTGSPSFSDEWQASVPLRCTCSAGPRRACDPARPASSAEWSACGTLPTRRPCPRLGFEFTRADRTIARLITRQPSSAPRLRLWHTAVFCTFARLSSLCLTCRPSCLLSQGWFLRHSLRRQRILRLSPLLRAMQVARVLPRPWSALPRLMSQAMLAQMASRRAPLSRGRGLSW